MKRMDGNDAVMHTGLLQAVAVLTHTPLVNYEQWVYLLT